MTHLGWYINVQNFTVEREMVCTNSAIYRWVGKARKVCETLHPGYRGDDVSLLCQSDWVHGGGNEGCGESDSVGIVRA